MNIGGTVLGERERGREGSLKMGSREGAAEAGRGSQMKEDTRGAGAACGERFCGGHRKTGPLATEI